MASNFITCFCLGFSWILLLLLLLQVSDISAKRLSFSDPLDGASKTRTTREETEKVFPPFYQCSSQPCDLRTHYCDEVVGICTPCEDACHPARVGGRQQDEEECRRTCGWYYAFEDAKQQAQKKEVEAETTTSATTLCSSVSPGLIVAVVIMAVIILLLVVALIIGGVYILRHGYKTRSKGSCRQLHAEDKNGHCGSRDDKRSLGLHMMSNGCGQSAFGPPAKRAHPLSTTSPTVETSPKETACSTAETGVCPSRGKTLAVSDSRNFSNDYGDETGLGYLTMPLTSS